MKQEEKAKAYDEALERAKQGIKDCGDNEGRKKMIYNIFPELAESEDERIRKAMIQYFQRFPYENLKEAGITAKDAIAWLEKQGQKTYQTPQWMIDFLDENRVKFASLMEDYDEQREAEGKLLAIIDWLEKLEKQESVEKIVERCKTSWYNEGKTQGQIEGLTDYERYWQGWHDALEKQGEFYTQKDVDDAYLEGMVCAKNELEKQGEQKETLCDKCKKAQPSHSCQDITALGRCYIEGMNTSNKIVEPKFKVGDWVVYKNDICQIVKREEGCNKLVTVFGTEKELVNERNLSTARLWTIQDAKDGDVLYSSRCGELWIYEDEKKCLVGYNPNYNSGRIVIGKTIRIPTDVQPATKEQRDLLFSKMKEAECMWDEEKKELKKIEQKHFEWGDEDLMMLDETLYFIDEFQKSNRCLSENEMQNSVSCRNWIKSLKERIVK